MDEFEGYQVLDISLQLTTVSQTRVHEGGGGGCNACILLKRSVFSLKLCVKCLMKLFYAILHIA